MLVGIGTDIVKVARFAQMQEAFVQRVFSVQEQAYMRGKHFVTAAGLFAAKEAVAKALGTGFSGFFPCDVEILHSPQGKPYVRLHNKAARAARRRARGRYNLCVSISHTDEDAVAFAALTKR